MSDLSPRRRIAGRALIGAAVLALPLTASISYAASEAAPEMPAAPEPPAPPIAAPTAPDAPTPPAPPEPGAADADAQLEVEADDNGRTIVIKRDFEQGTDGAKELRTEEIRIVTKGERLSDEAIDNLAEDLRAGQDDGAARPTDQTRSVTRMRIATGEGANRTQTMVRFECDVLQIKPGVQPGAIEEVVCKGTVSADALEGLESVRAEMAKLKNIDPKTRAEILEQIDRQIAEWKKRQG